MFDPSCLEFKLDDVKGKKILIRADLNISVNDISFYNHRVERIAPLIKRLINFGAHITLVTHIGRPGGQYDFMTSTSRICEKLEKSFNAEIVMNVDWPNNKNLNIYGCVVLAENVRFFRGEEENDPELAKKMAAGYDYFILEAFGTAHRKHASNYGILDHCTSFLGPLFVQELKALEMLRKFQQPRVAIIGGGKNSSKIDFIAYLLNSYQKILLGGQMANLFMAADGYTKGINDFDSMLIEKARELLAISRTSGKSDIVFPKDLWIKKYSGNLVLKQTPLIKDEGAVVDLGPSTTNMYKDFIHGAGSILKNGPVGLIENSRCFEGTRAILQHISESKAQSFLGGGDTGESVRRARIDLSSFDFISTGGGALLYGLCNGTYPPVEKLKAMMCEK